MTQLELQEAVEYNSVTGVFTWKISSGSSSAGKLAFSSPASQGRYLKGSLFGIEYLAHRLAWFYTHGTWPEEIDHRDGNGHNNKLDNLRECTATVNKRNRSKMSNNTSGHTGVCFDSSRNQWKAVLGNKNLGRFTTLEEAVTCREAAQKAAEHYTSRHGKD